MRLAPRRAASVVASLAIVACASAPPAERSPTSPSGAGSAAERPPTTPSAPSFSAPPSSPAPPAPIDTGAPFGATGESPANGAARPGEAGELAEPPASSVFVADLVALGLDPQNLPSLDKLDPRALRGVMRLFARSLGVKCADCHERAERDEGERAGAAASLGFALPTRRKKIATRMWNEFLVKLSAQDGRPLFCDSCHEGRVHYLDRRDKKALAAWMDAHFVAKLARKDGKEHGCETCHVDMDMTFLAAWGR